MAESTDSRSSMVAVNWSAPALSLPVSNMLGSGPASVGIAQRGLPRPVDGAGTPIPYITSYQP